MPEEDVREPPAETETGQTDDDAPELRPSRQRERQHTPDAYTVGYDATGETRVGVGTSSRWSAFYRMIRLNEGRHRSDGDHSTREAARDKKRITQSFCSTLGVTSHQQRKAVATMGRLNLDRFGRQKRIEKVALAVIQVTVDLDRQNLFFSPTELADSNLGDIDPDRIPSRFTTNQRFQELCDAHNMSASDRYSLSQLVKREVETLSVDDDATATE